MRLFVAILTLALAGSLALASPAKSTEAERAAHSWASGLGVSQYAFEPAGRELLSGVLLRLEPDPQVILPSADALPAGVYLVLEPSELAGECGVTDAPAATVVSMVPASADNGLLSVTCGAGFYACCYCEADNNNCPRAVCLRNHVNNFNCQGGGPGAVSCTISRSQCR